MERRTFDHYLARLAREGEMICPESDFPGLRFEELLGCPEWMTVWTHDEFFGFVPVPWTGEVQ